MEFDEMFQFSTSNQEMRWEGAYKIKNDNENSHIGKISELPFK